MSWRETFKKRQDIRMNFKMQGWTLKDMSGENRREEAFTMSHERSCIFFLSAGNYSPIDSSNLHQGDYFPAYLGNMQKVFHIFSEWISSIQRTLGTLFLRPCLFSSRRWSASRGLFLRCFFIYFSCMAYILKNGFVIEFSTCLRGLNSASFLV